MDDFERELRELPWRKPSRALKQKIFGNVSEQPRLNDTRKRGVPVKWSVVLAAVMGFVGFAAGAMLPNPVATTTGTDIRVVETFSARNSFDFSGGAYQILPGEFTTSISVEAENER